MKKIYALLFSIFVITFLKAQNTGIGTSAPIQTLDVNGAVKVGNSSNNKEGSIRYNAGAFEGGNGTTWKSFEDLPSKGIVISQSADTASIKAAGFSVLKQMDIWDTANIPISTNYPGSWTSGFPLSTGGVTPALPATAETVLYNQKMIYYGNDAFLYQYDIVLQKWTKLPNVCPLGTRNNSGVSLVGNDIFITGGWKFSGGFIFYNDCAKYNLLTNTWTSMANLPVTNAYHATAAIGTDIYLLGGISTSDFIATKKMYRYNTLTNTWSADLAVANTPTYFYPGQMIAYNNKLVYHNGLLKVYAYDPVASTYTDLNPGTTPAADYDFLGFVLSAASNKLYIAGSIKDTTTLDVSSNSIPAQYELDMTTGTMLKLNVCQHSGSIYCYQFNAADNKAYSINFSNNSFVFNRAGAQQCNLVLKRKGYWYYMKKN